MSQTQHQHALIAAITALEDKSASTAEDVFLSGNLDREILKRLEGAVLCSEILMAALRRVLADRDSEDAWLNVGSAVSRCSPYFRNLVHEREPSNIAVILDISTGHLTRPDAEIMEGGQLPRPMSIMQGDYGFLVNTAWLNDEALDIPASLKACLEFGRKQGCAYVLFDRDAPHNECLPVYEW